MLALKYHPLDSMRSIILFIAISLSTSNAFSQTSLADTVNALTIFENAKELYARAKFDEAQEQYLEAFVIFDALDLWDKKLMCLSRRAACFTRKGKFERALQILQDHDTYYNELGASRGTGDLYNLIGVIHTLEGKYKASLDNHEIALKIRKEVFGENHNFVNSSLNNIAAVYKNQGRFKKALHMFYDVEKNYVKNKNQHSMQMAQTYLNIGNIHLELLYYEQAMEFYQKSLTLRKQLLEKGHPEISAGKQVIANAHIRMGAYNLALEGQNEVLKEYIKIYGQDHFRTGTIYMNIGVVYHKMKDHQEALSFFFKSLPIQLGNLGKKHAEVAKLYSNIGNAYTGLHEFENAIDYLQKSLAIRKEILGEGYIEVGESQFNLGTTFDVSGHPHKARDYYQKSLATYQATLGTKSPILSRIQIKLAQNSFAEGNSNRAMNELEEAINANRLNAEGGYLPLLNDNNNAYINPLILIEILAIKADFLSQDNTNQNSLQSLEIYTECDSIIGALRNSYVTYEDKIKLGAISKNIYANAVVVSEKMFRRTGEKSFLAQSFFFAERSKANTFRHALNESKAKYFAGIPDSLLQKEKDLKVHISYNQGKALQLLALKGTDSTGLLMYQEEFLQAKQELRTLIHFFEENYPLYFKLKYDATSFGIEEVQKALPPNTTLLEYVDADSILYTFVISKNSSRIQRTVLNDSFQEDIALQIQALESGDSRSFIENAFQINEQIFAPLGVETSKVIVVPDGRIWNVNFDILLSSSESGNNFRNLPYLIRDYEITYLNAADELIAEKTSYKQYPKNECLAFSYENNKAQQGASAPMLAVRDANLSDLPGTRDEILAISSIIDGTYYYGDYASERNFKDNAKDYKIIHLALHGEIDDENPMNSKLHFTTATDSLEDNFLHAFEIYNLDLNAELAVLSACNTGSGELIQGEGLMSLARAFSFAGCKSLVMSQWDVLDATNPVIMKSFYEALKNGETKSAALRLAKLNYLNTASNNLSNPYLWASMIHIGDNSPTYRNSYKYWAISVIFMLSILIFFYKKRKPYF